MSIEGNFEHTNCWASQDVTEFPFGSTFSVGALSVQTAIKKYVAALKLDWSGGNAQDIRWHVPISASIKQGNSHGRWLYVASAPAANDGITLFGLGTVGDAMVGINASRQLTLVTAGGLVRVTGSVALTLNTWYWVAIHASIHTASSAKLYCRVYDALGTLVDAFDTGGASYSITTIAEYAVGVAFTGAGNGLVAYLDGGIGVSGAGIWPPIAPNFWSAVPTDVVVGLSNQWISSQGTTVTGTATGATSGSASAAGTMTDSGAAWGVNAFAGYMVRCGAAGAVKTMNIVSNTATVLTGSIGTASWSGGGNPGANAYAINPGTKHLDVDETYHTGDTDYLYTTNVSQAQLLSFPASGLGAVDIRGVGIGFQLHRLSAVLIGYGMTLVVSSTGFAELAAPDVYTGTFDDAGGTTLKDITATFGNNSLIGRTVRITGGTGAGQVRKILDNTATTLHVDVSLTTGTDSTYSIENYAYFQAAKSSTPAGAEWTTANLDDVQARIFTFGAPTTERRCANVVKFACYGGTYPAQPRRRGVVV